MINIQVLKIGYRKDDEARQLVERPVKEFALQYEAAARDRVLTLTRNHPFLVQLLGYEIVTRKNKQPPGGRGLVQLNDVEAAALEALNHSDFFFADIEQNQIPTASGRRLLRFLAKQGEGVNLDGETLARRLAPGDDLSQTLASLAKRDLIQATGGDYGFQVELIRRWFAREQ